MSPEVICCCGGGVISATNPKFDSFLGRLGLSECAPALAEAGVDCSEDLTERTEDEVVKEGLKRGHVKKTHESNTPASFSRGQSRNLLLFPTGNNIATWRRRRRQQQKR